MGWYELMHQCTTLDQNLRSTTSSNSLWIDGHSIFSIIARVFRGIFLAEESKMNFLAACAMFHIHVRFPLYRLRRWTMHVQKPFHCQFFHSPYAIVDTFMSKGDTRADLRYSYNTVTIIYACHHMIYEQTYPSTASQTQSFTIKYYLIIGFNQRTCFLYFKKILYWKNVCIQMIKKSESS